MAFSSEKTGGSKKILETWFSPSDAINKCYQCYG